MKANVSSLIAWTDHLSGMCFQALGLVFGLRLLLRIQSPMLLPRRNPASQEKRKWMPANTRESPFSIAARVKLLSVRVAFAGSALVEVMVKLRSPSIPVRTVAAALPNTLCVEG